MTSEGQTNDVAPSYADMQRQQPPSYAASSAQPASPHDAPAAAAAYGNASLMTNQQPYATPYSPQQSSPVAVAVLASPTKARFDYGGVYRDQFWLALFLVHLIIMVAMTAAYGQKTVDLFNQPVTVTYANDPWSKVLLPLLVVCACVSIAFSFLWIYFMKRWSGPMIPISFFIMAGLMIVNGIYGLAEGLDGYAAYSFIIAGLMLIYLYMVRARIPFTKAVMTASAQSLNDFPASIWLSYLFSVLQVGWFCFWVFGVISIILGTQSATGWAVFFFFLSLYWTSQVLANISHTTTAGMVGSWWFQPNVLAPTLASFKRATTTSLGSIALGSLIVAFIKALNSTLKCLCSCGCYRCFSGYIERIIRYFNLYTFSYVAIYGQPFLQSAQCTMDLFASKGFTMIINSSLVGVVLYVGSLIGGGISALVALAWVKGEATKGVEYYLPDLSNETTIGTWFQILYVIFGFFAGFCMTALSMTVFSSAVATTFIVWADDAPTLETNRPDHYRALKEASSSINTYPAGGAPAVVLVPSQQIQGNGVVAVGHNGQVMYSQPPVGVVYAQPVVYAQAQPVVYVQAPPTVYVVRR